MMNARISLLILGGALLFSASCQKEIYERTFPGAGEDVPVNADHPMKDSLQAIIDKYIAQGIPGVQVAVKNTDGWYIASGGYAKIESRTLFADETVTWYFSLTKTYTATLIMKLKERQKIDLDRPIRDYLPPSISGSLAGSDRVTVRMLLNHSSGIVNVTELPAFQLGQLNDPLRQPSVEERLEMVYGKPLLFEPGSDFSYSNTNFLLLTVIAEQVAGKPFGQLLHEEILSPLQLHHTFYGLSESQEEALPFPNYYFDRYANEQLENITRWNAELGNSSVGYGGIAGTAADAILFLEALVNGKVVNEYTFQEMTAWFRGKESTQPDYGLGLEYYQYGVGGSGQFGHEGDGIGCTTQVMYVPENDTYLYINCTAGRQLFGPYLFKTTDMKNELCRYVTRWQR